VTTAVVVATVIAILVIRHNSGDGCIGLCSDGNGQGDGSGGSVL
jgi:hypothetical protein